MTSLSTKSFEKSVMVNNGVRNGAAKTRLVEIWKVEALLLTLYLQGV